MDTSFVDSNLLHILMVLFVGALMLSIVIYRTQIRAREKPFAKLFGGIALGLWLVYNIYNFASDTFSMQESLPLHVCDVLAITSVLMLLTHSRKASTFLYFCALPLAGQAIMTPTGEQNPLLFSFWLFWLLHASILVSFVYDMVIRKYRPTLKDYVQVVLLDILYVAVILPIDIVFNFNYGFVGNSSPGVPTLLDVFGAWPQRVIWMCLAVVFVQFMMLIPWLFVRRSDKNRS